MIASVASVGHESMQWRGLAKRDEKKNESEPGLRSKWTRRGPVVGRWRRTEESHSFTALS
jgi:hypothetical protein